MIVLYSTGCPMCKILEKKLNIKKIEYITITDIGIMEKKGFLSVPKLEVDGVIMEFADAINWVNIQEDL